MAINTQCKSCGKIYKLRDSMAGKKGRCRSCGEIMQIPTLEEIASRAPERAEEHPKVYTKIHLEFVVQGQGVKPQAVERAIELSQTTYCPAAAMLRKAVDITTSYRIEE